MERLTHILIIILWSIFITSCSEEEGAYRPTPSDFSVVTSTIETISSEGGEVEIDIQGGNLGWYINSTANWCKFSKKSGQTGSTTMYGSGNTRIYIAVNKNTTGKARQGTVVIQPTYEMQAINIQINQH